MSELVSLVPRRGPVASADLFVDPSGLAVGDERVVDCLVRLGRRLLLPDLARSFPELAALGFFLRPANLRAVLHRLADPDGELRTPRGAVFHVPPANVDTLFGYSWALSFLAGNANVVRVSDRTTAAGTTLLDALGAELAAAGPAVAASQRFVMFPRGHPATAELSAACDLRVIWGSDATVDELRRHRLPPRSRDLTFPDRSSLAVIGARAWVAASPERRRALARGLHDDVFWYDQAACSSPRTLVWVGDEDTVAEAGAQLVAELLAVIAERGTSLDTAMAVHKRVAAYGTAATGVATRIHFEGNELVLLTLAPGAELPRTWLGPGTLARIRIDRAADLARYVRPADQTVVHFGLAGVELDELVRAAAGRGVDRVVPVGEALRFGPVWDGYDLLREFTRLVVVRA